VANSVFPLGIQALMALLPFWHGVEILRPFFSDFALFQSPDLLRELGWHGVALVTQLVFFGLLAQQRLQQRMQG
jgi:hypothetical protein